MKVTLASFLSCSWYLDIFPSILESRVDQKVFMICLEKHPSQHQVSILSWLQTWLTIHPRAGGVKWLSTLVFICLESLEDHEDLCPAFLVGPYRLHAEGLGIGNIRWTLSPSHFPIREKRGHLAFFIDVIENRIKYQRICLKAWRKLTLLMTFPFFFPTSFHTWQSPC